MIPYPAQPKKQLFCWENSFHALLRPVHFFVIIGLSAAFEGLSTVFPRLMFLFFFKHIRQIPFFFFFGHHEIAKHQISDFAILSIDSADKLAVQRAQRRQCRFGLLSASHRARQIAVPANRPRSRETSQQSLTPGNCAVRQSNEKSLSRSLNMRSTLFHDLKTT